MLRRALSKLRRVIVEAMRAAMLREGERLAYMAHAETGLGRAEDKVRKNLLVTTKTPGPEDLEPQARSKAIMAGEPQVCFSDGRI